MGARSRDSWGKVTVGKVVGWSWFGHPWLSSGQCHILTPLPGSASGPCGRGNWAGDLVFWDPLGTGGLITVAPVTAQNYGALLPNELN